MRPVSRAARRVAVAMREVDRRRFLPAEYRSWAEVDEPVPIGHGGTNSQPSTVAYMLRLLDPRPGMHVLDVGSGSGWTSELLAWLIGPSGTVVASEIVPELVAMGRANITAPNVRTLQAVRGVLGAPDEAPFDRILVSADPGRMPDALVAQLAVGGRMVIPVAGAMLVVSHPRRGYAIHEAPGMFRFVPLV